ncbi:MAG: hypothetical protein U0174_13080 [Polyangiaceae bacterium]
MQPSKLSETAKTAPNMNIHTSGPRLTPANPRVPFAEVMRGAATAGAEMAMRTLPGGPAIAVAVRGGSAPQGMAAGSIAAAAPRLGSGSGFAPATPGTAEGPAGATGGSQPGVSVSGTVGGVGVQSGGEGAGLDQAMAHSQEMNLYFLRVQEEVNAQNRTFTTLSNVMKAEHETVKTAIGNIR